MRLVPQTRSGCRHSSMTAIIEGVISTTWSRSRVGLARRLVRRSAGVSRTKEEGFAEAEGGLHSAFQPCHAVGFAEADRAGFDSDRPLSRFAGGLANDQFHREN